MNIRPFNFSDEDYTAAVNVHNAAFPDNLNAVTEWRSWDSVRDPKYFYERLVAEADGQIVGTVSIQEPHWTYKLGKFFLYYTVHPDCRKQGIGSALYDASLELLNPKQPTMLTSEAREDQPAAIKFLEKRGFRMVQRQPVSRLAVASFDRSPFADTLARFEASGLHIYTTSDLQKIDTDYWPKLHKLVGLIMQDVPMPEPYTQPELDQFIKQINDPQRGYNPDAWFIAVVPTATGIGAYAGMSCLWNDGAGTSKMYTGLTGVIRDYRRKGVATALKISAIDYANSIGAPVIETDNEENNPMFRLNVALGFREVTAFLEYEKRL